MCEHPKFFSRILNSGDSKVKNIVVHSKAFIKIIGILLLIVNFVKSSDQTIIQIMFLINSRNCFTGMYLKPYNIYDEDHCGIIVSSLHLSTIPKKDSMLGVLRVLDSPLELYNVF